MSGPDETRDSDIGIKAVTKEHANRCNGIISYCSYTCQQRCLCTSQGRRAAPHTTASIAHSPPRRSFEPAALDCLNSALRGGWNRPGLDVSLVLVTLCAFSAGLVPVRDLIITDYHLTHQPFPPSIPSQNRQLVSCSRPHQTAWKWQFELQHEMNL